MSRVPHTAGTIIFDPPISIDEFLCRIHRPGQGDARTPYELEASTTYSVRTDPEKVEATVDDITINKWTRPTARPGMGDLWEVGTTTYKRDHIARVFFAKDKDYIAYILIDNHVKYYNGSRLELLATTPL